MLVVPVVFSLNVNMSSSASHHTPNVFIDGNWSLSKSTSDFRSCDGIPFSTRAHSLIEFKPTAGFAAPSIGQDLWKQLKRVQFPTFSGNKRNYQSWKAAFLACIDSAPATGEYKLLQLRQYLSGEALNVIENLGHSSTAYEAAKERLERKYGGRRRQIAM